MGLLYCNRQHNFYPLSSLILVYTRRLPSFQGNQVEGTQVYSEGARILLTKHEGNVVRWGTRKKNQKEHPIPPEQLEQMDSLRLSYLAGFLFAPQLDEHDTSF